MPALAAYRPVPQKLEAFEGAQYVILKLLSAARAVKVIDAQQPLSTLALCRQPAAQRSHQ